MALIINPRQNGKPTRGDFELTANVYVDGPGDIATIKKYRAGDKISKDEALELAKAGLLCVADAERILGTPEKATQDGIAVDAKPAKKTRKRPAKKATKED